MQRKNSKITIQDYLDFKQLISLYRGSHKENRLFYLKKKDSSINKALLWLDEHKFRVSEKLHSETFSTYSSSLNNILSFISLIMGIIAGIALLSYSGNEPVNIIYYLFFAILVPIISMIFTLFSLFSRWTISEFFKMLFPYHWLEKLLLKFGTNKKLEFLDMVLSKSIQKYLFIERLQRFSLIFSLGVFLALLFVVITQDIAFSWSTTLDIEATSFYNFLEFIATPWRVILPSFMPSLDLVELSQHYRLGIKLESNMIENAHILGAWWKYLAINTLFYAIVLRFILWLFTLYSLKKRVKKEFFELYELNRLLREFKTPFIETKSPKEEKHLDIKVEHKKQVKVKSLPKKEIDIEEDKIIEDEITIIKENMLEKEHHNIIAWNFSNDEVLLVNDYISILPSSISIVGGRNSFEDDEKIANSAKDKILLYVKSWEPPTMDFVDFLEELIDNDKVYEIELFPIGLSDNRYRSTEKEFSIWNRKIEGLKSKKVWVINGK